jgi:hypothetical protein
MAGLPKKGKGFLQLHVSAKPDPKELEPRPPVGADLAALCRELNQRDARYVVIGGFAVIAAGLVFLRYWFAERGQEPPACS